MKIQPRSMGRFGKQPEQPKEEAKTEPEKETPEVPVEKVEQEITDEPKKDVEVEKEVVVPEKQVVETEEIDDHKLLELLKKKTGKDFKSFDELNAPEKEIEQPKKEEKVLNKDVQGLQAFLEKYPEKGISDYQELKKDWSKVSDIDSLRQKFRDEYGGDLTNEEADLFIKKAIGVDAEDDLTDLTDTEKLELKAQARKFKKEKTSSQEEILNSLKDEEPKKEPRRESEVVTLSNGQQVPKEQYQKLREDYLSENKKVMNETKEYPFKFQFANGEGTETITIPYTLTDEDREHILSATQTIYDPKVAERFTNKEGEFDFTSFQRSKLMELKGDKIMETLISNAYSQGLERNAKEERNVTFKETPEKPAETKKYKIDKNRLPGKNRSFGPRFSINKK